MKTRRLKTRQISILPFLLHGFELGV